MVTMNIETMASLGHNELTDLRKANVTILYTQTFFNTCVSQ